MKTLSLIPIGKSQPEEIPAKDFFEALKRADNAADSIVIKGVQYRLSSFSSSHVKKIGSITYLDINSLSNSDVVSFAIPESKPEGKFVRGVFLDVEQPFLSPTRAVQLYIVLFGGDPPNNTRLDFIRKQNYQSYTPFVSGTSHSALQDTFITFNFENSGINPQDFSQGKLNVFLELEDFPTNI